MIFHLSYEVPEPEKDENLGGDDSRISEAQVNLLKAQIRKNAVMIQDYIDRIDLFVNKEKYPSKAEFVDKLRKRLFILMEENDTFRKVVWQHAKQELNHD